MERNIIFWRSVPPDVNLGVFNEFSRIWKGGITVLSDRNYPKERQSCGWDINDNNLNIIILNESDNSTFLEQKYLQAKHAIHVFSGIRGLNEYRLRKIKKEEQDAKIVVIAERPAIYSVGIKRVLDKISHFFLYFFLGKCYSHKIDAFLALGEVGVKQYRYFGFNQEKIFQYMYCPDIFPIKNNCISNNEFVNFLYIGRFDKKIKGIDILMEAFDGLCVNKDLWRLDLVGGYGDCAEEVINCAKKTENITFIGSWNQNEICQRMSKYDVCIVPSKYDGWNLTANQAIMAGIATIISNQSGSDELIKYSGAGAVVEANNVTELRETIRNCINNRDVLRKWKANSILYQKKILPSVVADYFNNIIEYIVDSNIVNKPVCPWRNNDI